MSDRSTIEWTDATWNPLRGCSRVSSGCANCYAEQIAGRFSKRGQAFFGVAMQSGNMRKWTGKVDLVPTKLLEPLKWKRPRRIFVNSMSDLFHEAVPDEWLDQIFAVMALCPQHTFQVLTKRSARLREYFFGGRQGQAALSICEAMGAISPHCMSEAQADFLHEKLLRAHLLPLPNVWLGVSVENQAMADKRIPDLLAAPAAVRFLSCEPLLGPIDLPIKVFEFPPSGELQIDRMFCTGIDWIIAGGESGPKARAMRSEWVQSLRDQCVAAGVPFFFKQWGEWIGEGQDAVDQHGRPHLNCTDDPLRVGKKRAGRKLDSRTWDEYPSRHAAAGGV